MFTSASVAWAHLSSHVRLKSRVTWAAGAPKNIKTTTSWMFCHYTDYNVTRVLFSGAPNLCSLLFFSSLKKLFSPFSSTLLISVISDLRVWKHYPYQGSSSNLRHWGKKQWVCFKWYTVSLEKTDNCSNPSDFQNVGAVISKAGHVCSGDYTELHRLKTTLAPAYKYKDLSETSIQSFNYT